MKKTSIVTAIAAGIMILATAPNTLAAGTSPVSGSAVKTNDSDVIVPPETGAETLHLHFAGAELLYRNSPGELTVFKANGGLMHYRPDAYQLINGKMTHVEVHFQIEGKDQATVQFGKLDDNAPVILKWGAVMYKQPVLR